MKLVSLLFIVCAGAASAQPLLTLREAVDTALRTHPLLAAGDARMVAAAGYSLQAALRPNPRVVIQSENWRAWGTPGFTPARDSDLYAYVIAPIETAGKRGRRMDLAGAAANRTGLERQVLARQIALRVRQAYWNAAGAWKVHQLLLATTHNFQQLVDYNELRVRLGAMAEADLLKVQLERERMEVSARTAALDAERGRIQLFREMGQAEYHAVSLEEFPSDLDGRAFPAPAERPELKLAAAVVEQARANLRLQHSLAKPDVDIVSGYKRTAGFNTYMGGVQITLPVRNRNQGSIAAAEAEVRAAEAELAAVKASIQAEIRTAEADVRERRDQLQRLFGDDAGSGIRGKAGESSRIALAAYREGGFDLLRLLDAERVRIEMQVLYYKTLTDYRISVAALEAALGVNP